MPRTKRKISIIGCGNVGIRYAYALAIKGIAREIVLVDIDKNRTIGEAEDLSHTAPYTSPVEIIAGGYADMRDSDLVVITAGKKQKPGETRADLAKDNVELYKKMIPEVMKYAPAAIFLIVSNPVDALSYAAYKISGKPSREVIGSGTVLDSARFRFLLGKHCGVDPRNVHAYILGEHGDSEFAVWSGAMIGGVLFKDYCHVCRNAYTCGHEKGFQKIFSEVKNSGYSIIEKKGETSSCIGLALVRITQAIMNDENAVLPVSSLVNNYLGLDDVYLSIPAVVNGSGVREILRVELNDKEREELRQSAEAIKKIISEAHI